MDWDSFPQPAFRDRSTAGATDAPETTTGVRKIAAAGRFGRCSRTTAASLTLRESKSSSERTKDRIFLTELPSLARTCNIGSLFPVGRVENLLVIFQIGDTLPGQQFAKDRARLARRDPM